MNLKALLVLMLIPALLSGQKSLLPPKKILIVVSGYGKQEGKIRPGFEFDEYSLAYLIFKSNGLGIDVASPKGGVVESDGFNKNKPYNKLVMEDTIAMGLLRNTRPTAQVNPAAYAGVYIVGGKGAMFDLPFDPSLQELIQTIYEKQKGVVAAVCHGPAALVNVKLEDGSYLIFNKQVTGFSNEEEQKFGKKWKAEFPFLLEDKLKERGVQFQSSDAMLPQLSVDGRLITGQNPFSTTLLAEEIVKSVGLQPVARDLYADEKSMQLIKKATTGNMLWAKQELEIHFKSYDTQLIGVYGHYKLLNANGDKQEISSGLDITELVSKWVYNENMQYEMAKGYLQLDQKEKSKTLLKEIIEKSPSFTNAKTLLDQIK